MAMEDIPIRAAGHQATSLLRSEPDQNSQAPSSLPFREEKEVQGLENREGRPNDAIRHADR
jgi:hypothetical protein